MARRQDGRVLKVSVKSQLKFSAESEPAGDTALIDVARVFASHFSETLKMGTGAQSVRAGESSGRRAAGETESTFYCTYSSAESLKRAVDLFTTMNSIAVAWAHRDWKQLIPGLMSVSSQVSVESVVDDAPESLATSRPEPAEEARGRNQTLAWLAAVFVAFLLGMAAARADLQLTRGAKPDERESIAAKSAEPEAKPIECVSPKETPSAAAPVTVNCTCPAVRVSCPSRTRDEPTSQRWESLSR